MSEPTDNTSELAKPTPKRKIRWIEWCITSRPVRLNPNWFAMVGDDEKEEARRKELGRCLNAGHEHYCAQNPPSYGCLCPGVKK